MVFSGTGAILLLSQGTAPVSYIVSFESVCSQQISPDYTRAVVDAPQWKIDAVEQLNQPEDEQWLVWQNAVSLRSSCSSTRERKLPYFLKGTLLSQTGYLVY
ncbi:hypothetical protein T484DRAFT_2692895 [Baffinella frigidus]|nr:hypothetical protein T484DRAFT_2692895 [Cryptophyta sp. CCMP2293]